MFSRAQIETEPGRRRHGRTIAFAGAALISLLLGTSAEAETFVMQNEPHLRHARELVLAALDAAGMKADFRDAPIGNERRNMFMMSEGQTHLDMMPATPERLKLVAEGRLRMIPIPLDRGMLGYRVNFVLRSQQDKLAHVRTAADLAAFTIGQNVGWMDTAIYRAAGIPTKDVKDWANGEFAQPMEAGYIDLFPLGLEETLDYFLKHVQERYPQLTVDSHILVHYPWFRFVWVSPKADADALYEALQRGFDILVANGRFLEIWNSHNRRLPAHEFVRRTVIEIPNPFYDHHLVPLRYRPLLIRLGAK